MSHFSEDIKRVPWVEYLADGVACEGIRWSDVPGKALYPWGPGKKNPPTGLDPYRCKNMGHWRFTALPASEDPFGPMAATSGVYCWPHLWSLGLIGSMEEDDRFRAWLEKEGLA